MAAEQPARTWQSKSHRAANRARTRAVPHRRAKPPRMPRAHRPAMRLARKDRLVPVAAHSSYARLQIFPQFQHAAADASFHRAQRLPQFIRNLHMRQPAKEGHLDGLPLDLRQFADCISNQQRLFCIEARCRGRNTRLHPGCHILLESFDDPSAPVTRAQPIDGAVTCNTYGPMKWSAQSYIEHRGFLPDLDEDVLNDFLGFLRVPENVHGDGEKHTSHLVIKIRQGLPIAGRHTTQQLGLGFFRGFFQHSFLLRAVPSRKRIGTSQLVSDGQPLSALNCTGNVLIYNMDTFSKAFWMPR